MRNVLEPYKSAFPVRAKTIFMVP